MFNFDLTEYQKTFTEQAEKVRGLTEKAFKINTEFAEAAIARQTQVATELAKTNTEYVKGLVDIENLKNLGSDSLASTEKLVKGGEAYVGEVKESITAVYEESVASLKKYQSNLEKVVSQLSEISDVKKTPAKKTAKAS